MGRDHPDGTLRTIKAELVAATVVPEIAAKKTLFVRTSGKVTTTSTAYQTVATWTTSAVKNLILHGVEAYASPFTKALFRLSIGGVEQYSDVEWPTAINHFFPDASQPALTVILLEGRSLDGTSVDMWGIIEGMEVG